MRWGDCRGRGGAGEYMPHPLCQETGLSISVATFYIQPLNGARFSSEADLHFRTARATVAAMKDSHTVSHTEVTL